MAYYIKPFQHKFDFPKYKYELPSVIIRMTSQKNINFSLTEYNHKFSSDSICEAARNFLGIKHRPLSELFFFDNGA